LAFANPKQSFILSARCFVAATFVLSALPWTSLASADEAELVKALRSLPSLQKTHYSWAVPGQLLANPNNEVLLEYIRITHAVSINDWTTEQQVTVAVIACKQINEKKPKKLASIAVNYSPWHRVFPKNAPPTDMGPSHAAELERFRDRMERIRDWVEAANRKYDAQVAVSALLLDTERFHVRPGDAKWNEAIRVKYDAFFDLGKKIFPKARIEWYNRGVMPVGTGSGWQTCNNFPLTEKADGFSCALYRIPEMVRTRETFKRTLKLAKQHGNNEVTPWVALASGYRRGSKKYQNWDRNWDYDLIYSWQMGAELNHPWFAKHPERFGPYDTAKIVVFYPAPFYQKTPAWPKHFVAYVKGAHQIKDLPE
jgi:hypothetical protein